MNNEAQSVEQSLAEGIRMPKLRPPRTPLDPPRQRDDDLAAQSAM